MLEIFSYSFVMPPTIFIVISLLGAIIAFVRPRFGIILSLSSNIFLYLFATPAVSLLLMQQLVSLVPAKVDFTDAQAIVVPGVDVNWGNGADIPNSVGTLTLERLAGAAQLYRRLRLPVLVSGGEEPGHPNNSLANLMRAEFERTFDESAQFLEAKSRNTFENALYSSQILTKNGMYNVIIVAQERDMPRLLWSFIRVGLRPMPFSLRKSKKQIGIPIINDFLPSAKEFLESYYAMHEIIGLLYYKMVH